MPLEQYELLDWEAWAIPGSNGGPDGIRITSDTELPFENSALLRVVLLEYGFEFQDRDGGTSVTLVPSPGPAVTALFAQCLKYALPVVLTEVDFFNKKQRTWLASPRPVGSPTACRAL